MAYREYDNRIFRDYFDVDVMDVALLSEAERQYKRVQPTKPEMYKIKETFNNYILDDFAVVEMMVGAHPVVLNESPLKVQPCTLSETMRERAALQTTGDAAMSVEHLDMEMWPAEAETLEKSGELGGLNRRSIAVPGPQQKALEGVEWGETDRMPVILPWSQMGIMANRIPAPRVG